MYRKRRLLAAFDPRARYLRGLGQDDITAADLQQLATPSGANDIYGEAGPSQTQSYDIATGETTPTLFQAPVVTPTYGPMYVTSQNPKTGAMQVSAVTLTPSSAAASASSWWSTKNAALGVTNGTLAMGIGAIAALVLLMPSGRKR